MTRTGRGPALVWITVATLLTATATGAAGAETTTGSAAACHGTPHELVGGRWENLYFCADVVGYIGAYQDGTHVYLDRADYGPHPDHWAGHLGERVGTDSTQQGIAPGDHWWRVCSHDEGDPYYCTGWYHQ